MGFWYTQAIKCSYTLYVVPYPTEIYKQWLNNDITWLFIHLCHFGHMMQVFPPCSLLVLIWIPLWPHQLITWCFTVTFSQAFSIPFDSHSHIGFLFFQHFHNSPLRGPSMVQLVRGSLIESLDRGSNPWLGPHMSNHSPPRPRIQGTRGIRGPVPPLTQWPRIHTGDHSQNHPTCKRDRTPGIG